MTSTCESCRFFARHKRQDAELAAEVNLKTGDCRRLPPTGRLDQRGHVAQGYWPRVLKTDWCGGWQAAEMAETT